MKQRPILFSTAMVLAILEGRKSQTRRIVSPQPVAQGAVETFCKAGPGSVDAKDLTAADIEMDQLFQRCPYGQPGDILWVREEHYRYGHWVEKEGGFTPTGRQKWMFVPLTDEVLYEAPESFRKGMHNKDPHTAAWHKRLARFMPRHAARIFLQVTDRNVERLQDITEQDAKAEGLACLTKDGGITYKYGIPDTDGLPGNDNYGWHWHEWEVDPRKAFRRLWEKINGPDSWEANPWDWVVSFKRIEATEIARAEPAELQPQTQI